MSFLEVIYESEELHRKKEIRILSCEQICGKHIRLIDHDKNFLRKVQTFKEENPKKCQILSGKNIFVKGPNSNDITINQSGKSPWYLIRAIKNSRKQLNLLILNQVVWGIEISSGLRMKKSVETHGKDKIAEFIFDRVSSIFSDPEEWEKIVIYHREEQK
ncbi:hypothetical protein NEF87_001817 [Candidatus Lokiarchaeum ossiferum]|uniref:Uncharacterized protein n=1 Tax=Candidatus Lokiarchaeum ossiferum TaxID=2951803 RepID=A0ABY6HT21_9ARCH|nr:hypothetical protein NEF87_001817 [Candidatus Lokiarchaeum sp. B-35]